MATFCPFLVQSDPSGRRPRVTKTTEEELDFGDDSTSSRLSSC